MTDVQGEQHLYTSETDRKANGRVCIFCMFLFNFVNYFMFC